MALAVHQFADSLGEDKYDCREFVKEWTIIGKQYQLTLNGLRANLNALGDLIAESAATGFKMNAIPNLDPEVVLLIPEEVICRTPRLVYKGEGLLADLVITGEEGLNNGKVEIGQSDLQFLDPSIMPPNVTFRTSFEPTDVALAYGLPFRAKYKWDLEQLLPNPDCLVTYYAQDPTTDQAAVKSTTSTIADLLRVVGYIPENMSLLAVCNVWREGSITEQQRGAIYSYLNAKDTGAAPGTDGAGDPGIEYAKRILRGQDSYRYWLPHVTLTRRWRRPPDLEQLSRPGEITVISELRAPPAWTGAPIGWMGAGEENVFDFQYKHWATGPQLETSGEFWLTEEQWTGFLEIDEDLIGDPSAPEEI